MLSSTDAFINFRQCNQLSSILIFDIQELSDTNNMQSDTHTNINCWCMLPNHQDGQLQNCGKVYSLCGVFPFSNLLHCLFVCRVMLLAVLCLVAMVENQSSQHISKIWQLHHIKVMISNKRINWAPVSGNCNNLFSVHRTRVILHSVRGSMRHSGSAN